MTPSLFNRTQSGGSPDALIIKLANRRDKKERQDQKKDRFVGIGGRKEGMETESGGKSHFYQIFGPFLFFCLEIDNFSL